MPVSKNSPGASTGPSGLKSKAEALEEMTDPYGPEWPLDGEILARLQKYPGALPRNADHYLDLLPDPLPPTPPTPRTK